MELGPVHYSLHAEQRLMTSKVASASHRSDLMVGPETNRLSKSALGTMLQRSRYARPVSLNHRGIKNRPSNRSGGLVIAYLIDSLSPAGIRLRIGLLKSSMYRPCSRQIRATASVAHQYT